MKTCRNQCEYSHDRWSFRARRKNVGNNRNGSDSCDDLHRISRYEPGWGRLRTRYSSVSVVGAGKTSLILKCLPQLPRDYKVVLLKNEFGDVQGIYKKPDDTDWGGNSLGGSLLHSVDSQLAIQSNLSAVSEILNGCM